MKSFMFTGAFRTHVILTMSMYGTGQGTPSQFSEEATEAGEGVPEPGPEPIGEAHLAPCECLQYASYASSLNPTRFRDSELRAQGCS